MAIYRKQVVETEEPTATVADRASFKAESIIYWIAGVIELLLLLRLVLSLFGANRGNAFAQFIYGITYPFVAPFYGLFNSTFDYGVSRLEYETLIAMLVVAIIAWIVGKLFAIARR